MVLFPVRFLRANMIDARAPRVIPIQAARELLRLHPNMGRISSVARLRWAKVLILLIILLLLLMLHARLLETPMLRIR